MDRLTTGRRHLRAGSVTVTELLSRQASPTHCTESSPTAPDNDHDDAMDAITDTIPVVVPAPLRREPAKGAQLAKLASLGVAGVVLCGAVTISSLIAHQRRESGQTAIRPSAQITGEQALLPDKLDKTVPEAPAQVPEPRSDNPPAADKSPGTPEPTPVPVTPGGNVGTTASGGVAIGPASDLELVREFYESLPDAPIAAFNLLSPDVLGASLADFRKSWSTVAVIDSVDVTQRPDGVLATVCMRLADGGWLRVQQLLTVAESPRRIVGVQLLSAQRN